MTPDEAEASVDALIEDLRYLMGTRPHTKWPEMASAAIEHHSPRIEEHLLTWQYRRLQRAGHLTLTGLADSNAEQIRAGIIDIRTIEVLTGSPVPADPKPPTEPTPSLLDEIDLTAEAEPGAAPLKGR